MRRHLLTAAGLLLLAFIQNSSAQTVGNVCVRDFRAGAVCTANDVRIEDLVPVTVVEDCQTGTIGQTIVQFEALVSAGGSPDRFDVGLFIALDGGSARDGDSCLHEHLSPPLTLTPTYGDKNTDGIPDIDDGPWLDNDGDQCGDIATNSQVFKTLQTVPLSCNDSNLDGSVDVSVCTSWDNNSGSVCNVEDDAFPGTNAKCSCGVVELGIVPTYALLTKTADTPIVISGDSATFTITAQNTGIEGISGVVLSDPQCDVLTGPTGDDGDNILETTETWTWTCTVNNVLANFTNTANMTGTSVVSGSPVNEQASDDVVVVNPSVSIVKSGIFNDISGDGFAQITETISYSFLVTNTGDTVLTDVLVSDPLIAVISCPGGNPIPTLAIGASTTCTGTLVLDQADIDSGVVDNTASVSGDAPNGNPVTDSDSASTPLPQDGEITVVKFGTFDDNNGNGSAQAGETISYSFLVNNTGDTTLFNILVSDPLVAPIGCPGGNPIPTLAPGAGVVCSGTYVLTQADVDAGQRQNTATVTAEDPQGDPETDDDTTTTPLPTVPALIIAKSGVFNDESGDGSAQAGETISYSFLVENIGDTTLFNILVSDPLVTSITCPGGNPIATLVVGASITCTGSYVLTPGDINNGQRQNTATATGEDPQGDPVTDTDVVITPLPVNSSVVIVKSGTFNDESGDGSAQVGETISYSFLVENTGDTSLFNILVSDPLVTPITCPGGNPIPTLVVGASITCTGSYVLTQADVDAGQRQNTATATGEDPQGDPVTDTDVVVTPLPNAGAITITKSGTFNDESGDGSAQVGETISYSFLVENTGDTSLFNILVSDPLVTPITCPGGNPIPTLVVGASITCTGSYVLTQADVDAGQRQNTATAAGEDPQGDPVTDTDVVVTPLPNAGAITITKSGTFNDESGDGSAEVGETISYSFLVENTGDTSLFDILVSDPLVTPITCPGGNPIPTLAVGASITCTGSYVLTQADVDAGQRQNTATAAGEDPQGDPVTDTDVVITPLPNAGAITITKSGTFNDESGDGSAQVGETISYSFLVENTGDTSLFSILVSDPLVTPITCPGGNPIPTLAIGASITCTGSYVVTQADVDAGQRQNTATAAGEDPQGDPVTDTDVVVTPLPNAGAITITKSGTFNDESGDGSAQVGETISYSFLVQNTGDTTLFNILVSDPLVTPITCPGGNPIATLTVGASITCTGSYVVTQADVDAGQRQNTATAAGEDPQGDPVTDTDVVVTPLPNAGAITITKSGTFNDESGDGSAQVGETISYSFLVANTGDTSLFNILVSDPLVTPITCPGGNPIATLTVGASITCTGSYVVTQADVDAGQRQNTATAAGEDPQGDPVTDTDVVITPLPNAGAITITKSGTFNDESGDGSAQVGETISYSFLVENTGDTSLFSILVSDPLVTPITCPGGNPIPTLAIGASITCTGSYVVTQADVDAGQRQNTATAAGEDPQGDPVTDTDVVVTPLPNAGAITITKSGTFNDESGDGSAQVGETISYSFLVENTGDTSLFSILVSDPLVTPITCPGGNPIPTLAIGASITCTGSYVVTQADVDAGQRQNTATAAGEDPQGDPVTDTDVVVTPLPNAGAITITKSGTFNDESGDGSAQVGETISYSFLVQNTGDTTLFNILVSDPLVTPITCPGGNPVPTLAVGASITCTGSYAVTQTDIDDGERQNTATAAGEDPQGDPVTDSDTIITPLPGTPGISLVKTGTFNDESADGFAQAGETISYSFLVTNTGPLTLMFVEVTDPLVPVITCPGGNPIASIDPGASVTCTGTYTVLAADVDAGERANTATAAGMDASETPVSDTDDFLTPLPSSPAITITKTGTFNDESGDGSAQVGETIGYSFLVANSGSVTLSNILVSDPLVAPITCPGGNPIPSLAIGASVTCTGSYVVTQVDVDAAERENTATAAGEDPQGDPVTDTDTIVTPLPNAGAITIAKSGTFNDESGDGSAQAGETIGYSFLVTNSGTVTLSTVLVSDPLVTPIACPGGNPIAILAVGASITCTGSYVVTQADVDAGQRQNTATAAGEDPQGDPVTDSDTIVTPLPSAASISLVKTGTFNDESGDGSAQAGETIAYSFLVTNAGSVTLSNVLVSDPLVAPIACPGGNPIATLAIGASITCTGSYAVTQIDIDNGDRQNTATAAGEDPQGEPVSDTDTVVTPLPGSAAIDLVKTGVFNDESGDGAAQVGETISYTFVVTNTSALSLLQVSVTDPLVAVISCPGGNPIASIAPGASVTCTGSYPVTQADIDAGERANTATAAGVDVNKVPVSDSDSALTPLAGTAAISLIKSGQFIDSSGDGSAQVGETISYTFVVTNTGGVTLVNIQVSDPIVAPISCPGGNPITSLTIGASLTCTGSYVLTQTDVDAGERANTATATGEDTEGNPVTDSDTVVTPLPGGAAINLIKSGTFNDISGDGFAQVGETISYAFLVSNSGGLTLSNVLVSDPLVAPITCLGGNPIPTLTIGASVNCTGTYVLTQADIDAAQRPNTATATGQDPEGNPVSDDDSIVTPLPVGELLAEVTLLKSGSRSGDTNGNGVTDGGDRLTYRLVLRNTSANDALDVMLTDTPDAQTTLVTGTVSTTQGSVLIGNSAGDTDVAVEIGTVPPGGQVVVIFDVTINNPVAPGTIAILNQGVATGSNFTEVESDDPETSPDDDPTETPLGSVPAVAVPMMSPVGLGLLLMLMCGLVVARRRRI